MGATEDDELIGRHVVSIRSERIGKVDSILTVGGGGDSEERWALVKMGLLGTHPVLVPLRDAIDEDGDLKLVYEKEHIHEAPAVETGEGTIGEEDADTLHRHYGLERVTGMTAPGAEDEIELSRETRDAEPPGMDDGPDNPFTKRRLERAKEFGVPGQEEARGEGGDARQSGEAQEESRAEDQGGGAESQGGSAERQDGSAESRGDSARE